MPDNVDVLITGAGPTGLFLGCLLAENHVSFRIIDRKEHPEKISKASGIMPRTLEVFRQAGIVDRFLVAGNRIQELSIYGNKGKLLVLPFDRLETPYPYLLGLEQYRTEELLGERLAELGVEVERPTELVGFEQDDAKVYAELRGPDGSSETVLCRYLVGCDGAHSTVRHSLGLSFDGSEDPQHYVVAYLTIDWEIPRNEMFEFNSPNGTIFGIPLPEGRWAIAGEYDRSQWQHGEEEAPDLGEIERLVAERSPVPARLSDPLWLSYFRVNHRQVERYQLGRVFLVGDAAHVHTPAGGQGMNTGLQDAHNLAWKLALVTRGTSSAEILGSYHDERHPVGHSVVHLTSFLQSELNLRSRIAMGLRDELSQLAGHSARVKNLASRQLGELSYHYRRSGIVGEWSAGSTTLHHRPRKDEFADCPEFGAGPHAGDRIPDGPLLRWGRQGAPEIGSLYELLDCRRHTLLLFEGTHLSGEGSGQLEGLASSARRAAGSFSGDLQVVIIRAHAEPAARLSAFEESGDTAVVYDDEAVLHHRCGARQECLYLLRPDGYIAYRSEPADIGRLLAFLEGVGMRTAGG